MTNKQRAIHGNMDESQCIMPSKRASLEELHIVIPFQWNSKTNKQKKPKHPNYHKSKWNNICQRLKVERRETQGAQWALGVILDCVCGDGSIAVYICQNSLNYMLKIGIYKFSFQRVDFFKKSSYKYHCLYFWS